MPENFIRGNYKMKNFKIYFALLIIGLVSATAFADVKIKSRQTASGQTFENTTYIKGKRQRTEQNMGGMQMVNLTQCDLKRDVQLNEQTKTFLINSFIENVENTNNQNVSATPNDKVVRVKGGTITSTVTYKDTGETRKMFGYNAKHIITTMETSSTPDACALANSKMQIDGWYIDAAFALDCETDRYKNGYIPPQKQGCQDKYQMKTIGNGKRGYPVYEKMTMLDDNGKESFSTVTEVIELSQATLDAALFEVPADYREVRDSSQMYSASINLAMNSGNSNNSMNMGNSSDDSNSGTLQNIRNQSQNSDTSSTNVGAKKEGTIRIGINVKTGSVGDGLNAGDLAAAVQNTLGEYLKGTNIELVPLEAKLASAIDNEAKEKECDFVLYVNASHKKGGGGGFGMLGKSIGSVVAQTGGGSWGNTAANNVGRIAANTIVAATVSQNVKAKDEITLDIKLQKGGNSAFSKQYKAKAKSNGDDILSPMIEQIAEAILANTK